MRKEAIGKLSAKETLFVPVRRERQTEILGAISDFREGRGQANILVISGAPGVGKTTFLDTLAADFEESGTPTIRLNFGGENPEITDIEKLPDKNNLRIVLVDDAGLADQATWSAFEQAAARLHSDRQTVFVVTIQKPPAWRKFENRQRVLTFDLPLFTEAETEAQVGSQHAARIQKLTGGLPAGNRLLAKTLEENPGQGDPELAEILFQTLFRKEVFGALPSQTAAWAELAALAGFFEANSLSKLGDQFGGSIPNFPEKDEEGEQILRQIGRLISQGLVFWDSRLKIYRADMALAHATNTYYRLCQPELSASIHQAVIGYTAELPPTLSGEILPETIVPLVYHFACLAENGSAGLISATKTALQALAELPDF